MSEARKVYIVTSGEYSGYGIEAAFSTPELAYGYLATLNYPAQVEHYELDIAPEAGVPEHLTAYIVTMDDDGNNGQAKPPDDGEPWQRGLQATWHEPANRNRRLRRNRFSTYVVARDEQHALKIANEQRVKLIWSGEWENRTTGGHR